MMKPGMILSVCLLLAAPAAVCQGVPGPGGPGERGQGHERGERRGGPEGLLPPGAWWKNPETVKALGITDDQRKRIEEVFQQSRMQLVDNHATLEKLEIGLEPLLNASPFDQGKALAQISKIADARAELEKANARMLLGVRALLTPEQWTKLRATRPRMHGGAGPEQGGRGEHGRPGGGGPAGGPGRPGGTPQ